MSGHRTSFDHDITRTTARRGTYGRLSRLCLKELRETLRDRRTLVTLFLMPILVYPLLSIVFHRSLLSASQGTESLIGVESEQAGQALRQALSVGERLLAGQQESSPDASEQTKSDDGQRIAPNIFWRVTGQLEQRVKDGTIDLGVVVREDDREGDGDSEGESAASPSKPLQFELLYRQNSPLSERTLRFVEDRLTAFKLQYLRRELRKLGGSSRLPLTSTRKAIDQTEGEVSLAALIPLVLILMTVTGAVYPAIDLTAGERERGTLEALMAAPMPRLGLLLAKYVAVVTVAFLTAAVNLLAMTVTLSSTGLGRLLFGNSGVSLTLISQFFWLLILFAAFFSAMLLALTSFARSFKEAQAYLIPLMLLSLAPGVMSLMPGLRFNGLLAITPVANIVMLARDLFGEGVDPMLAVVAVLSTVLYTIAAIGLAARIFGTDAVLYGSQASWSDLLRGPRTTNGVSSVPGSLMCLAILFPSYFLVANSLGRLAGLSLSARLLLTAGVTAILFGGIPWVAARLQKLNLTRCFQIRSAPAVTFAAAILLGCSLWPLVYEIFVFSESVGLVAISEQQTKSVAGFVEDWKEVSPLLILLAMAITPAIFEELFFRGYLFSSLKATATKANTILSSAVLFGLFHVVATSVLATERFVPSTLVGLMLGWVCWRTGSVLPGILLHATHNSFLLLLAYYRDEIIARGWLADQQRHLPMSWLCMAAVGLAIGAALVWFATNRLSPLSQVSETARQDHFRAKS